MKTKETRPRIVVGVDGSPNSVDALRKAARIAELTAARIEAVNVWHMDINVGPLSQPIEFEPDHTAMLTLRSAIEAARIDDIQLRVRRGPIAGELIDASESADLLVVGRRGRGGIRGALLGSVSATCAEYAKCPVLVVHGDR